MYEGIDFSCISIAIEANAIDMKSPDTGIRYEVVDFSCISIAIETNAIAIRSPDTGIRYEVIDFRCISIAVEANAIDMRSPDTASRYEVIDFSCISIAIEANAIDIKCLDTDLRPADTAAIYQDVDRRSTEQSAPSVETPIKPSAHSTSRVLLKTSLRTAFPRATSSRNDSAVFRIVWIC